MTSPSARSVIRGIVERLAHQLQADIALVGDFLSAPFPRVRTLTHRRDGAWQRDFSYPLAGHPCELVRSEGTLVVAADAAERFPEAAMLRDDGAQAYAGLRLTLHDGEPGLLALLFRAPLADAVAVEAALRAAGEALQAQAEALAWELERERLQQSARYRDEFFREYVLDNPEGLSLSEFIPPIPVDLPLDEQVERIIHSGHVVECNNAIARMYGYPSHTEMMGARPLDVQGEERARRMVRFWVESDYRIVDFESQAVDADGNVSWIVSSGIGGIEDGKLTHFWTKRRDITDRKRYEAAIQHRAHHDALTGLPNRYWFQDRLAQLLEENRSKGKAFALMLLDLNRFKEVNDTLGHGVGDQLLRAVARRLLMEIRPLNADIARLGGDEFAMLVPDLQNPAQADRVAQATLALLAEPFTVQGMDLQIGGSIGVCSHPGFGDSADELMRLADIAMYSAKNDADGYRWYQPDMDRYSRLRLLLLAALGPAIEDRQLFLEFQPKITAATGEVQGFEALVRWSHPDHGVIPPAHFIALAETSDVIQPLTRWVIHAALQAVARWQALKSPLRVAVNLSARNLLDKGLADFIAAVLAEFQLPASVLELEITESVLMARPEHSLQVLQRLSDMGVSLAIDDFGTGYSSLAYLARLPVSTLKIDQSFVRAMGSSRADKLIVRSVISLAKQLGLSVVAEGVEDAAALRAIAEMGCQYAQGYHIARPLAVEAVPAWLAEQARPVAEARP